MRKYFWELGDIYLMKWTDKYINDLKIPRENDICLMIHNKEGELVGHIIMRDMNERAGWTDLIIEIKEEYRRMGYGSSAMEIMLEYAFEERRLHKVNVWGKASEVGTDSFLYQLGFVFEAYRSGYYLIDGEMISAYYYGMTEEEYRDPHRKENAHKQAPVGYLTPVYSDLGEIPDKDFEFYHEDYDSKDDCFYCDGLKYRATTREDCLILNQIVYDTQVSRFYDDDVKMPGMADQVETFLLEHIGYEMDDNRLEFAIEENGEFLGCVNLTGIEREDERVSASIYINPKYRGNNYGGRALRFAFSYAANEFNSKTFHICVSDGNVSSARMMRKLGLKLAGVQREAAWVGGKYVDTLFFEAQVLN